MHSEFEAVQARICVNFWQAHSLHLKWASEKGLSLTEKAFFLFQKDQFSWMTTKKKAQI